jgi:hypothetical protein
MARLGRLKVYEVSESELERFEAEGERLERRRELDFWEGEAPSEPLSTRLGRSHALPIDHKS